MGIDLARGRHHSLCAGRRAYRVGLATPFLPQAFELPSIAFVESRWSKVGRFRFSDPG
jgi:hypothetical protein